MVNARQAGRPVEQTRWIVNGSAVSAFSIVSSSFGCFESKSRRVIGITTIASSVVAIVCRTHWSKILRSMMDARTINPSQKIMKKRKCQRDKRMRTRIVLLELARERAIKFEMCHTRTHTHKTIQIKIHQNKISLASFRLNNNDLEPRHSNKQTIFRNG